MSDSEERKWVDEDKKKIGAVIAHIGAGCHAGRAGIGAGEYHGSRGCRKYGEQDNGFLCYGGLRDRDEWKNPSEI